MLRQPAKEPSAEMSGLPPNAIPDSGAGTGSEPQPDICFARGTEKSPPPLSSPRSTEWIVFDECYIVVKCSSRSVKETQREEEPAL